MARNTRRARPALRSVAAKSAPAGKCTCNPGWMLIAIILASLGIYGVAAGFVAQFYGLPASLSLPGYFIGLILLMFAKLAKMKGCACMMH